MADDEIGLSRRAIITAGAGAVALGGAMPQAASAQASADSAAFDKAIRDPKVYDQPKPELVMNIVVTCSSSESMGPSDKGPDGIRPAIYPIVGGRFAGPNISGVVLPGGGDFPVTPPNGVRIVDALYRLRTDDGWMIIIHNRGLVVETGKYRLTPTFIVNEGKYDWLTKGAFISTLINARALPPALQIAKAPAENDRMLQIFRIN